MAAAFVLFLLLSAVTAAAAQQKTSNISLGSSLTPITNSSWFSPSQTFAFGFYQVPNGYAICIFFGSFAERTVVWTANRDNPIVPSDVKLLLANDGRLILQHRESQDIYSLIVNASQPIAWASMLDNGNFLLYNSDGLVIWQSFDQPTDTLLPGQRLAPGGELYSRASETDLTKGNFRLHMQTDGQLVQYPVNTPDTALHAYYVSQTYGAGDNVSLNLENDGRLHLLNGSSAVKNITRGGYPVAGTIYLMRIDVDGILRLYKRSLDGEGNWTSIWSSTEDKCHVKGVCGTDSFCTYQNQIVNCTCLPDYVFVQKGNWTAGCSGRNFSLEGCENRDQSIKYEIRRIPNATSAAINWGAGASDDNFTEEECRYACLDDCSCGVAFFHDGQCQKLKALRYGIRSTSISDIAFLKVSAPSPEVTGDRDNSGSKKGLSDLQEYVIIGVPLGIAGLVISSVIIYYTKCRLRNHGQESNQNVDKFLLNHGSLAPKRYSYNEIKKITKSFTDKLGQGGYGIIYKGELPDGQLVAVKVLNDETGDNAEEFINEVASISRTSHVNIVNLLGFCYHRRKRALIYEFMPNKSLDKFIYKNGSVNPECSLEWEKLYEIVVGVARGLEYLHRGCNTRIVHFDIKPQNILLDKEFCPKISDFGLAKLFKKTQSMMSMLGARGTIGYIAPEVFSRSFGIVSHKSDVYSYGMMLLQMVEARKIVEIEATQSGEADFAERIYEHFVLKSKTLDDLMTEETEETVRKILLVGFWCIQTAPSDRPSMTKVVEMLEGYLQSIRIPPKPFLSSPNLFGPLLSSSFSIDVEIENSTEG